MRHRKNTVKLGRNSSHRRAMFANMLKSLITHERIETSVPKAKALRSYADKMISLGKKGTLAAKRAAIAKMMIRYNTLTPKEARAAKAGDKSSYNDDRFVMDRLTSLASRFAERNGGYTRIIRLGNRTGDSSERCYIEYLAE